MTKATCILFDTNFSAEMKKENIKDGKIILYDKEFFVDKVRPFTITDTFGGTRLLYLFKWNMLEPLSFMEKDGTKEEVLDDGLRVKYKTTELVPMTPEDLKQEGRDKILPQMLKDTMDMRFLKQMKPTKSGGGGLDIREMAVPILIGVMVLGIIALIFSIGGPQKILEILNLAPKG